MILLITNKEDTHPTPVINLLRERGVPIFRLNTEALLTDYQFFWQCNVGSSDFWMKNVQNGLEIRGSEITAVWERRPEKPTELLFQNNSEINKHNLKEALGFLQFLRFYIKDIFSIGSIVNDRVSASKMLQLKVAREVGLKTPDTCFSNRKEDILKFAEPFDYLILKSIENDGIWDEIADLEYLFYSKKIGSKTLQDLPEETFTQTVNYIQNYVEKQFELRVTVVGNHFFACKIDSQILDDDKGKIDWRQGYDHGLKHEIYDFPQTIKDKCLQFLNRLGLHFGCFDFIYTPNNEYVFLECNPNGQWLWIEYETGMKISEAIADTLMKGKI
jgi:glutathione synthase/RimK-type ligase-like ATP-grasp enzyme